MYAFIYTRAADVVRRRNIRSLETVSPIFLTELNEMNLKQLLLNMSMIWWYLVMTTPMLTKFFIK